MDAEFDLRALQVLRSLTGSEDAQFHDGQLEAIRAVALDRKRVLVVQRTGWGKSAVYFVATKLLRDAGSGPTLLISPLFALMRNQIQHAERAGVRSVAVNSTNPDDWDRILHRLRRDEIDLMLVSEQRLKNERFKREYLPIMTERSGLLVVDEAHCISDWGHDFRPWYRRIARFVELLPTHVPVLGCTATANDRVVADVQAQLGHDLVTFRGPLGRDGLALSVVGLPSPVERLAWLAQEIPRLPGTGIVYCLTQRDTTVVADFLQSQGIDAVAYSGADTDEDRVEAEAALLANLRKVVVATSALGMGFDKPDLGFVVHFQMPGSPIAYYQQVGRAGRQLPSSAGIGLVGAEDEDIQDWFIERAFPSPQDVDVVLAALRESDGGLSTQNLEAHVNVRRKLLEAMLTQLEVEGAVEYRDRRWHRTLLPWSYPHERIAGITAERRREQQAMRDYRDTAECRSVFLRRLLDDRTATRCGLCDNCTGKVDAPSLDGALLQAASRHLRRQELPIPPRLRWPNGLGEPAGAIAQDRRNEPGWALCRWGDPIHGAAIRRGKQQDSHFSDDLVDALVGLVRSKVHIEPGTWVTSVPSLRTGELVGSLARRAADQLSLPYIPCVAKRRETHPQKTRENSPQQVSNIWGAFEIDHKVETGPVLLVDDIVDSRWTFTVVGFLLRSAGSGPVIPIALADTAGS